MNTNKNTNKNLSDFNTDTVDSEKEIMKKLEYIDGIPVLDMNDEIEYMKRKTGYDSEIFERYLELELEYIEKNPGIVLDCDDMCQYIMRKTDISEKVVYQILDLEYEYEHAMGIAGDKFQEDYYTIEKVNKMYDTKRFTYYNCEGELIRRPKENPYGAMEYYTKKEQWKYLTHQQLSSVRQGKLKQMSEKDMLDYFSACTAQEEAYIEMKIHTLGNLSSDG